MKILTIGKTYGPTALPHFVSLDTFRPRMWALRDSGDSLPSKYNLKDATKYYRAVPCV
jgi:hypothetical protein